MQNIIFRHKINEMYCNSKANKAKKKTNQRKIGQKLAKIKMIEK